MQTVKNPQRLFVSTINHPYIIKCLSHVVLSAHRSAWGFNSVKTAASTGAEVVNQAAEL